jgi:hypothetical protein
MEQTADYPEASDVLDEYLSARAVRDELKRNLKPVEDRVGELELAVIALFEERGDQSVKRRGHTVYLSRDISVKSVAGDTAAIVDVLRKARLGELIGINHPKLKAFCKERMHDKTTDTWEVNVSKLPPSLQGVVEVTEFTKLGCRKS